MKEDKYGYRAELLSRKERDIIDILSFEIFDLGNIVPLYALQKLIGPGTTSDNISRMIVELEKEFSWQDSLFMSDEEVKEFVKEIITALNQKMGKDYKYGLWLTDIETLKTSFDLEDSDIKKFEKSDIEIKDTEKGWNLYLYDKFPHEIED